MLDLSAARTAPPLVASAFVHPLPPASRFALRGDREVMLAAGSILGLAISGAACTSAYYHGRASLWLGPDEQLVLAPETEGPSLARQLGEALAGTRHSLVDVSHRQIAFEVRGPMATSVLNAGCPLDLHAASFPLGMCTRTILGRTDIVLWRKAADIFHVEVWRSFADYATRFLAEASRELAG
jgi:sarcosine oxidase subunit gamma